MDSRAELEEFLKKKDFDYAVVPKQEEFIKRKLDLQFYPTDLIVDKNGSIAKVLNTASEMILFPKGETELGKKILLPSPTTPK